MAGKKGDVIIAVTSYDQTDSPENIVEFTIVSPDSRTDGCVMIMTCSDFALYLAKYKRKVKVYVDNLRVVGESIIAYMARERHKPIYQVREPGALRGKGPVEFSDTHDLVRILANQAHWYRFDYLLTEYKQVSVRDWSNIITADIADIVASYGYDDDESNSQAVARMWRAISEKADVGTSTTVGAMAMAEYKRTIGKKTFEVWFPELPEELRAYFRLAYHGGLAGQNCDRILQQLYVCDGRAYDCNSLYPYTSTMPIPYGLPKELDRAKFAAYYKAMALGDTSEMASMFGHIDFDKAVKAWTPIFRVQLDIKRRDGHMPCVYYTHETRVTAGCPVWETSGPEEFIMTRADLEMAIKHYDIRAIDFVDGYEFQSSTELFKAYYDKWYTEKANSRASGDKAGATVAKMMLNNLSGKFGSKLSTRNVYLKDISDKVFFGWRDQSVKGSYSPAAAYITAYARQVLADKASENWEHVIQYDTDCIFYDCNMDSEFKLGDALGEWKVEHEYSKIYCHATKVYAMYTTDDKVEIKAAGAGDKVISRVMERIGAGESGRVVVTKEWSPYTESRLEQYKSAKVIAKNGPFSDVSVSLNEMAFDMLPGLVRDGELRKVEGKTVYVSDKYGAHATYTGMYSFTSDMLELSDYSYEYDELDNEDEE